MKLQCVDKFPFIIFILFMLWYNNWITVFVGWWWIMNVSCFSLLSCFLLDVAAASEIIKSSFYKLYTNTWDIKEQNSLLSDNSICVYHMCISHFIHDLTFSLLLILFTKRVKIYHQSYVLRDTCTVQNDVSLLPTHCYLYVWLKDYH